MNTIPKGAKKIEIANSTVDFYEYEKDGESIYFCDTSTCQPPEPMINAMLGLELIKSSNKKLIMLNHSIPNALFHRIDENYSFEIEEIDDVFKVEFSYKKGTDLVTDFSDNKCLG